MQSKLTKAAAIVAFIIGAMAIVAGGQIVLGGVKDYYVIDWLPIYNLAAGLISALFTSIVIWKGCKIAMPAAIATLASHMTVFLVLLTAYSDVVAPDSIVAMTVRITAWLIVLSLMVVAARKGKQVLSAGSA